MDDKKRICIHWFRRDLRLEDNAALYHALKSGIPVLSIFIFDSNILNKLENRNDKRVIFIHRQLESIQKQLKKLGSSLVIKYGDPITVWKEFIATYSIDSVFTNHDYEPYARERDEGIGKLLQQSRISWHTFKDQVIFEKDEVVKDDGKPYTVYTPYSRKWMGKLNDFYLQPYPCHVYFKNFLQQKPEKIISLKEMSFIDDDTVFPKKDVSGDLLKNYATQRDLPGVNGTSLLGIHLRFGTISIRALAHHAQPISFSWLNELIWREFYMSILWHFPHAAKSSFKPAYDHLRWRNNAEEFALWCEGKTGYPIVDAGMRQLNETGFMHNRVRMVVASFLTKHLLIDWRWGEAYFAQKLLDFELSSNNGGWQWAAGSGCDAAPYFRIFNPYEQTKKFDPQFTYIRKWVPEFEDFSYPSPIVDHKEARERCLSMYKAVLAPAV
ncbi:deoxyribodipyrimidine photo-lyase [soil metagenome]